MECHDPDSLEQASIELRACLDRAFPDSRDMAIEPDKVNYMLSSVFFLANRLAKACRGLSEFDSLVAGSADRPQAAATGSAQPDPAEFGKKLDRILAEYF